MDTAEFSADPPGQLTRLYGQDVPRREYRLPDKEMRNYLIGILGTGKLPPLHVSGGNREALLYAPAAAS